MKVLEEHLNIIQDKLQLLLKQHSVILKENQRLKEELAKQQEQGLEQVKSMDKLKQQVDILKLSTGKMNEKDKKEFEKRMNLYIRNIDRCIALLSR